MGNKVAITSKVIPEEITIGTNGLLINHPEMLKPVTARSGCASNRQTWTDHTDKECANPQDFRCRRKKSKRKHEGEESKINGDQVHQIYGISPKPASHSDHHAISRDSRDRQRPTKRLRKGSIDVSVNHSHSHSIAVNVSCKNMFSQSEQDPHATSMAKHFSAGSTASLEQSSLKPVDLIEPQPANCSSSPQEALVAASTATSICHHKQSEKRLSQPNLKRRRRRRHRKRSKTELEDHLKTVDNNSRRCYTPTGIDNISTFNETWVEPLSRTPAHITMPVYKPEISSGVSGDLVPLSPCDTLSSTPLCNSDKGPLEQTTAEIENKIKTRLSLATPSSTANKNKNFPRLKSLRKPDEGENVREDGNPEDRMQTHYFGGLATPRESPTSNHQGISGRKQALDSLGSFELVTGHHCDGVQHAGGDDTRLEQIYKDSVDSTREWPDGLLIIRRVRWAQVGLLTYVRELQNGDLRKYEEWAYAWFRRTGQTLNNSNMFQAHNEYVEFQARELQNEREHNLPELADGVQIKPVEADRSSLDRDTLPAAILDFELELDRNEGAETKARPLRGRRRSERISKFFTSPPKSAEEINSPTKRTRAGVSCIPFPPLSAKSFGLVQETLAHDPFQLLAAVIFLNKTKGLVALPAFWKLVDRYPTPSALANAAYDDVVAMIQHLGLQNMRAKKLIALGSMWLENPPVKGRRHRTINYPFHRAGKDVNPGEVIDDDDERLGAWEIAHLPGCGDYAIDSWRIFCRDKMRGLAQGYNGEGAAENFEPEWRRVVPGDKELRAFLRWMWLREGWDWTPTTGKRVLASEQLLEQARSGALE